MLSDTEPSPPDEPEPEDYIGRHRLPDTHPDHGIPLEPPTRQPNPCSPVDNHIPCGHITRDFPKG